MDPSFILLFYVDDILITSKSKIEIKQLKAQLKSAFNGEAKKIQGMEFEQDRVKWTVCLSQKQHLKQILIKFDIDESVKLVTIPLLSHFELCLKLSLCTNE